MGKRLAIWWLFFLVGIVAMTGCGTYICQTTGGRQAIPPRLPLSLINSGTELLIAEALRLAVDGDSASSQGMTVLVLNSVTIYRPPSLPTRGLLTVGALPRSDQTQFALLSRQQVSDLQTHDDVRYVEVYSILFTGDEATVDVVFWQIAPVRGGLNSAKGPILLFRRVGDGWAFVEVKAMHCIN